MLIYKKRTPGVLFIKVTIPHPTNPCSTSGPLLKRGINGMCIYKKEAPNFRLELPSKSGDDLLSHKRNEVEFVDGDSS